MKKIAVGIMSGTSLDGIDVAIAEISGYSKNTKISLIGADTLEIPTKIKQKIINASNIETSNVQLITSLHYELGELFGEAVIKTSNKFNIPLDKIDFIASHGQTIWHQPYIEKDIVKSTLQIGEGAVIAAKTKTTVISNFRAADIAAGGEGAPLVSYVDDLLFRKNNENVALHNLGGISNLTLLHKDGLLAYDTGPANMMINYAVKKLYNLNYDNQGKIAKSGQNITELYNEVMNINYFNKKYPKSTGRELFGEQYTNYLINKYINNKKEDLVHTFTKITIDSIVNEYKKLIVEFGKIDEIIFSGGGVFNTYLIDEINKKLPNVTISTLEKYGMSSEFKEALAFIILGNETLNKIPSNKPAATGAKRNAILGQINYYGE